MENSQKGGNSLEFRDDIKKRLKRVEGQVRGVLEMMEKEKTCKDVVGQLKAVRNAVDKAIALIVAQNLEHCLTENKESNSDLSKVVQEAVDLLVNSR